MAKKRVSPRAADRSSPALCLFLLGTFRIEREHQVIHLPRRKVESLLAYLALYPEEHSREQLASLFWGDFSDEQARTSLRTSLVVLRKHLGEELLLADREVIRLNPNYPIWMDTRELELRAASTPSTAGELYRGELLTGFYEDWISPKRDAYRELYLDTLLQQTQELRAQSEYERAVETARQVLVQDPANERAYQHLMFCFMAQGNRQAALEEYENCARALQEELTVEPAPETKALYRWIKQTPSDVQSPAARITNLPIPLTSFIGRAREMAEVKSLLTPRLVSHPFSASRNQEKGEARLVTLIGAGGSGKTRLSIQVGTDLIDSFKDGVWWVELGPLADPGLVPKTVARALGLHEVTNKPPSDTIVDFVQSKQMLLVLDNCEHVIDACARLAEQLLTTCPNLHILATSREPLKIEGENVWQVPTLAVPPAQALSLAQLLLSYEGIRLFVDRARAAKSDFALTDQNAPAVAQICQRLDGIPLAMELAAARVRTLSPEQIAQRLDDRFNLLTGGSRAALPRQQTLRALIDWSYNLLSENERTLFRRVSAFVGGFTLEAAEAVCCDQGPEKRSPGEPENNSSSEVLELLSHLVDKSLVLVETWESESRYRLLETIRDYAGDKLCESVAGERTQTCNQHLEYFVALAMRIEPELERAEQATWMERLEREHGNIRAALQWAEDSQQIDPGLRLAATLWRFWKVRGHYSEGRNWYTMLLDPARVDEGIAHPATRAYALYAAGMLAYYQSDYDHATELQEASLAIERALGSKAGIARALSGLGLVMRGQGDYARAQTLFQESLGLYRELGDVEGIASGLRYLGLVAIAQGDAKHAVELYEQARPLYGQLGDAEAFANLLNNWGIALSYLGDLERAEQLTEQSLAIRRKLGDPHGTALSLHTLSFFAKEQNDWPRAKDLLCEALRLYHRIGTKENTLECLESIAYLEYQMGNAERAAEIYSATLSLRGSLRIPMQKYHRAEFETEVEQVRTRLDAQAFKRAWEEGHTRSLDQAIDRASTCAE